MAINLARKGVRDSLTPRREPYWGEVGENTYLGYRKTLNGSETWIARYQRPGQKKKQYKSLGAVSTLKHGEALKLAQSFGDQCRQGIGKAPTVAQACQDYVTYIENLKGSVPAKDAEDRLKRTVARSPLASIKLDRLGVKDVQDWLFSQRDSGRKDSTINRDFRFLKAALNHAFQQQRTATTPWKAVKRLPGSDGHRDVYLDADMRKRLLVACEPALELIVKGLLLTACRTGELRKAVVKDFDEATGTLQVSTQKGKDGKERTRSVHLSNSAVAFFAAQCKGKMPLAPIFMQPGGKPWSQPALNAAFRKARKAAGMSGEVVPYCTRHTAIATWLTNGVDLPTVCLLAGTSADMIIKHYHKFVRPATADKLNTLMEV